MSAPTFYGQGNPVLEAGFAHCVYWCSKDPEMRRRFERDTGQRIPAAATPIEAAIDEATGLMDAAADAFVEWVAAEVWGIE